MEEQENKQAIEKTAEEPEFLYHYTTEEGLYGILESQNVRATHCLFLNDSSERLLGFQTFEKAIIEASKQSFLSDEGAIKTEREFSENSTI